MTSVLPQKRTRGACSVEGCSNPHAAKSYCRAHYERVKAHGRLDLCSPVEKFWSRVDRSGGCWIWQGYVATNGYGRVRVDNRFYAVHRFAWQVTRGALPERIQLDHMCHQRLCVNPAHLRPVEGWQNQQNHQGATAASSTGVRGVFPAQRKSGGYVIAVKVRGTTHRGGPFETLDEAADAVVKMRNELCTHNDRDRVA